MQKLRETREAKILVCALNCPLTVGKGTEKNKTENCATCIYQEGIGELIQTNNLTGERKGRWEVICGYNYLKDEMSFREAMNLGERKESK